MVWDERCKARVGMRVGAEISKEEKGQGQRLGLIFPLNRLKQA